MKLLRSLRDSQFLRSYRVALSFMTVLPVAAPHDWQEGDARQSVQAYPLVGLSIGIVLVGAFTLLTGVPDALKAALTLAIWVGVSGALHLDGLCDTADAVFASTTPEKRQLIAKDVHMGAFAFAAGSLLLIIKVTALSSLQQPVWLLMIPLLARTFFLIPMTYSYPTRNSQLASSTRIAFTDATLPVTLGVTISGIIALCTGQLELWCVVLLAGFAVIIGVAYWIHQRMDGLSGDAYGALIELAEALLLVLIVSFS